MVRKGGREKGEMEDKEKGSGGEEVSRGNLEGKEWVGSSVILLFIS